MFTPPPAAYCEHPPSRMLGQYLKTHAMRRPSGRRVAYAAKKRICYNGNMIAVRRTDILIPLTVLLYGIFILHILALFLFWYWRVWWFDIPMHYAGGAWIGGMTAWWVIAYRKNTPVMFASLAAALLVGIAWEAFEFGVDMFSAFLQNDIVDTLSDLGADVAGGLSAGLYFARRREGKERKKYEEK